MCVDLCVCVLRIVSMDKILCFTNTLIMIYYYNTIKKNDWSGKPVGTCYWFSVAMLLWTTGRTLSPDYWCTAYLSALPDTVYWCKIQFFSLFGGDKAMLENGYMKTKFS